MKIKAFTYEDKSRNWRINRTTFNGLTLLVGASGVGKTQLLKAIRNITQIAQGKSFNGASWSIEVEIDGSDYTWRGKFEVLSNGHKKPRVVYEKIIKDGKEIIKRDENDIYFNDGLTVKLPPEISVVDLITNNPIDRLREAMGRIVIFNLGATPLETAETMRLGVLLANQPANLRGIRGSKERIRTKLHWCSQSKATVEQFDEIKQVFKDVFPFVEDIRVHLSERDVVFQPDAENMLLQIQIKERGSDEWINEIEMSSGMHKVLLQICELHLCEDGTVFLIDEFENSLGVNCIDDLVRSLVMQDRGLQFIITSHHPYIINNISQKNWKIVTRKGREVTVKDAAEYGLGKSKHQAFMQLINLDAYLEGITA